VVIAHLPPEGLGPTQQAMATFAHALWSVLSPVERTLLLSPFDNKEHRGPRMRAKGKAGHKARLSDAFGQR